MEKIVKSKTCIKNHQNYENKILKQKNNKDKQTQLVLRNQQKVTYMWIKFELLILIYGTKNAKTISNKFWL